MSLPSDLVQAPRSSQAFLQTIEPENLARGVHPKVGVRYLGDDDARVPVLDLDRFEVLELLTVGGVELGVGDPHVRVLDVLGRHLAVAVGPHDAGLQAEREVGRVDLLDVLGSVVHPGPFVAGLVHDQAVEDCKSDVEVVDMADRRVEREDVGLGSDAAHLLLSAGHSRRPCSSDHCGAGGCHCFHEAAT